MGEQPVWAASKAASVADRPADFMFRISVSMASCSHDCMSSPEAMCGPVGTYGKRSAGNLDAWKVWLLIPRGHCLTGFGPLCDIAAPDDAADSLKMGRN